MVCVPNLSFVTGLGLEHIQNCSALPRIISKIIFIFSKIGFTIRKIIFPVL